VLEFLYLQVRVLALEGVQVLCCTPSNDPRDGDTSVLEFLYLQVRVLALEGAQASLIVLSSGDPADDWWRHRKRQNTTLLFDKGVCRWQHCPGRILNYKLHQDKNPRTLR
jgi:hypothetical protein